MIKIRKQLEQDEGAVKCIIAAATDELRSVYRPIQTNGKRNDEKPISIVAVIKTTVVGFAEFLVYENNVLVRGLAVSPMHRRQGVAKTIIEHIMISARKEGKTELVLRTVKETGNTSVFSHMGFNVASEEISELFESIQGEPVTLVNMRKIV